MEKMASTMVRGKEGASSSASGICTRFSPVELFTSGCTVPLRCEELPSSVS